MIHNPKAEQNALGDDPADRDSMWQGEVGNFLVCRQMLTYYESWRDAGTAPPVLPTPRVPTHPEPSFHDLQAAYAFYYGEIRTGDISRLREDLTNGSGCGAWVPARAGDANGPTVADVIRETG